MAKYMLTRSFNTSRALLESLKEPLVETASEVHHGSSNKWKNLFFYVCVPAMGLGMINVALEEHEEPPEFKKYQYLRKRTKPFPWGDGNKTLFHNPHMNPLPDGFEHDLHKA